jgi:hypothetical protein
MSAKPSSAFAAFCLLLVCFGCGDGDIVFPGMVPPSVSPTATVVTTESPSPNQTSTPTPLATDPFATSTPTPSATPDCLEDGETCVLSSDCCSEECDVVDGAGFVCQ